MFKYPRYKIAFFIYDFISLALLIILGRVLIKSLFPVISGDVDTSIFPLFLEGFFLTILGLFIFRYNNLYQINIILSPSKHFFFLTKSIITFFAISLLIQFIVNGNTLLIIYQHLFLAVLFLLSLYLIRLFAAVKIYKAYGRMIRDNILIVGDGEAAKYLTAKLFIENTLNINILGFISEEKTAGEVVLADKYVLGNLQDLPKVLSRYEVDEILISMDKIDHDRLLKMMDECNRLSVRVKLTTKLFKALNERVNVEKFYDIPVLEVKSFVNRRNYEKFKKIFDFTAASSALIILSPLLLIIAFLIKVTSRGPVIFSQERIGKNAKPFRLYKFRSMLHNGVKDSEREKEIVDFMQDEERQSNFKILEEAKVTKIGKILRKTSLDELPQLFNVVKGDMSLVGPRPCLPYEFIHYKPWQRKRVEVMPGCTGLWQVFGRNSVSFIDSITMDIYYTYKMSFLTDLEYIFRTIPSIILAKGK